MENYSHYSAHSGKSFQNGPIINLALLFCVLLLALGIVILSTTISYVEYFMGANVTIIVIILVIQGVRAFLAKPNQNNQLEQTKSDVKIYFNKINNKNRLMGRKFEWICPDDFMYLEVHYFN